MKIHALQTSQVRSTESVPAALSVSRTTFSAVRSGLKAGATAYMRKTYGG